ncbi:MAG TPA: histidinol-phosphate transaminase, partial [Candidatus Woesebacteria bacterium]|nr:histidinol-phosphate transaminase [Candidatus Woesebacteria bacterium]
MNNIKLSQAKTMKQLYAFTTKRAIDLSLSENPLGCSPLVLAAAKNLTVNINDYPLANGRLLKKALADHFTLSENNFFIANGSEAIINYLAKVFGRVDDEVLVPALTFPLFAISTKLAGKKLVRAKMTTNLGIDLAAMREAISAKTCLIFLCNPNNPTGAVLPQQAILDFLDCVPKNVLLVVDEANIEFAGESVISEIKNRDNLLVLRTFSKGFGLAGLRVGFATANNLFVKISDRLSEQQFK